MFTLYHSNQLDHPAKELLVSRIRQAPLSHPSIGEQILVQSPASPSGSSWSWQGVWHRRQHRLSPAREFHLEMFTRVLADVPARAPQQGP